MKRSDAMHIDKRQQGAATIAITMLIIGILTAALMTLMSVSSSAVRDAAQQEAQIAAFFLAESGQEKAHAILSQTLQNGTYTETNCSDLALLPASALGRGTFEYVSALPYPADCPADAARCCAVTVKGTVDNTSRWLRVLFASQVSQGIEGNGSQIVFNLVTTQAGAAVFTNLAYMSKTQGGSNAHVASCTNPSGSCLLNGTGWDLAQTGSFKVSGMGVYGEMRLPGNYGITQTLLNNQNNPAPRNYVQVGAVFYPVTGQSVSFIGSYADDHQTSDHKSSGVLPANWFCAASNGIASASVAASADTLLYGFSSATALAGGELNAVSLGDPLMPQLYFRQRVSLTGKQGDNLFSQIWTAYNPAYFSTAGASNGANFMGTIGAKFSGTITGENTTKILTLTSGLNSNAVLSPGDVIKNSSGSVSYGELGALISGIWGQSGSRYQLVCAATLTQSVTLLAYSPILKLVAAPGSGVLTPGDEISSSGGGVSYGVLPNVSVSGGWGEPGSRYLLSGSLHQVDAAPLESAGTTVTLSGLTPFPPQGGAVSVSAGSGLLDFAQATGEINGTTLQVYAVSSGVLNVGDALFGLNIKPGTVIAALGSGSGGVGSYQVNYNQSSAVNVFVSRTAVYQINSANSYVLSKRPAIRLSGNAQICGGVCAFFFGRAGVNSQFNLLNQIKGEDWSSGFACLKGVDPNQLEGLNENVFWRHDWSEPVR